ncbi:hypothetical protein JJD41_10170 [Oxynema sp. CENA135]|uniref:hypothetical protein n=1 Tax=Oxynema sp. CENA135 TaxID=984206 RepID=UPI00190C8084|nr:hypothetical protein [Oxynema sp. CENA135]MBK4730223.1 hypothetical protein [Oxynema sp. CENA135]
MGHIQSDPAIETNGNVERRWSLQDYFSERHGEAWGRSPYGQHPLFQAVNRGIG